MRAWRAKPLQDITPQQALTKVLVTLGGAEPRERIKLARGYTGSINIDALSSYPGASAGAMAATGDPRRVVGNH